MLQNFWPTLTSQQINTCTLIVRKARLISHALFMHILNLSYLGSPTEFTHIIQTLLLIFVSFFLSIFFLLSIAAINHDACMMKKQSISNITGDSSRFLEKYCNQKMYRLILYII